VPDATEIAGDGAHIHTDILGSWSSEGGREIRCRPHEDEEGIARHSGQPEPVDKDYGEHCASHKLDRRSDQFDGNVQVDVTMQAAKCGVETPSISAHPVLGQSQMFQKWRKGGTLL